jgi:gluconokinase
VLACSALKKTYRDHLRASASDIHFIFLELDRAEAQRRVATRSASHFFSASLVGNQFDTLESPVGEAEVLVLDATDERDVLHLQVIEWLRTSSRTLKSLELNKGSSTGMMVIT